jgi:phenylalanine ammonia-lyase
MGLRPVSLGQKKALELFNGAAFSLSVATLAQYRADTIAMLTQILIAMGVEALMGITESFLPSISSMWPQRGQFRVAQNISILLSASKLASAGDSGKSLGGLANLSAQYKG